MPESRVRAATPWLVKHIINPIMLLTGSIPSVSVRGRRSGKLIRTPVNVVELNGTRYLTSPRGETGWSRNLRVTGEFRANLGQLFPRRIKITCCRDGASKRL